MSTYSIKVSVHFDPCALQPHDFQPDTFGLAALTKIETCSRCDVVRYPRFEIEGIDRSSSTIWNRA
jgi:hypothetical protein